jgi:DNA-binding NtrC family response regulator
MAEILIVDDEEKIGQLLSGELRDAGHTAAFTVDPGEALDRVRRHGPDILITDLRMPGMDGVTLLRETRAASPSTDVIVMTAYASLETALETMREGAYDYIIKPFKTDELLMLVGRIEEKRRLADENEGLRSYIAPDADEDIVGTSSAVERLREVIRGLSASDASVLIRGESGTGKELVARAIHRSSSRAAGPFIAINCAAIPESLLESELFGYEKGAFTGATRRRIGHFQLADRGTLFLDEIGDLPMSLQAKLLRVLETQRFTPLGGESDVQVDVRLVSATHQPLEERIGDGSFREDLFYRLNVFPIVLPPLRERPGDIAGLARHFLAQWGRSPDDLGDGALARLSAYNWPGNIRELRNVLERATILRPEGAIDAGDILIADAVGVGSKAAAAGATLNLAEVEQDLIRRALEAAGGNKSEAARLLGITRRALYGRLERYGMDPGEDGR